MFMALVYDQYTIELLVRAMRRLNSMSIFIDASSKVDREGLRLYVLSEMDRCKQAAETICVSRQEFWDRLATSASQRLFDQERQQALTVIDQLVHLPQFIQTWMTTALDSAERFEFFIMTKAHELNSGDQQKDYYWALQIRHDQLVALVRVMEMLLDKMKLWVSLRPDQVFDDPVFAGLTEYNVEQQIFLEAERIYKERQTLAGTDRNAQPSSS
jgi:hypothetical protein